MVSKNIQNLFKEAINYKLKDIKYTLKKSFNFENKEILIIEYNKTRLSIFDGLTIESLKKRIDESFKPAEIVCKICDNEDTIKIAQVHCTQCNICICVKCYIDIIKTNYGLYICPYCRFKFGHKATNDLHLLQILEHINNNFN